MTMSPENRVQRSEVGAHSSELTLLEFFGQQYLNKPKLQHGSGKTPGAYRPTVNHLNEYFRDVLGHGRDLCLADLSVELIQGCMAWRASLGRAGRTVNNLASNALAMWRYAGKLGLAAPVPDEDAIEQYPENQPKPDAWFRDEVGELVSVCRTIPGVTVAGIPESAVAEAFILLLDNSGERLWAITELQWTDFSLECARPYVVIRSRLRKDREESKVTLREETVAALLAIRLSGRPGVWDCVDRPGRPLRDKPAKFRRLFKTLVYHAFIDPRAAWGSVPYRRKKGDVGPEIRKAVGRRSGPQKMRRTFVTQVWFHEHGGPTAARTLACHSSSRTTERSYVDKSHAPEWSQAHLVPPVTRKQLRLFDAG